MSRFIPRDIPHHEWLRIASGRDFAVRAGEQDHIFFRIGSGGGVYVGLAPSAQGWLACELNFESGEATILGRLPQDKPMTMGRSSECDIRLSYGIISRKHLQVESRDALFLVRDLNSTNGSFWYKDTVFFDIQNYLDKYPIDSAEERTLDLVHEQFGPKLNDFLRRYQQTKKEE